MNFECYAVEISRVDKKFLVSVRFSGVRSRFLQKIIIILLVLLAMFRQRTINYYPRTILMHGRRAVAVHWKAERNSSVFKRVLNAPIEAVSRVDELRLFQIVGAAKQKLRLTNYFLIENTAPWSHLSRHFQKLTIYNMDKFTVTFPKFIHFRNISK